MEMLEPVPNEPILVGLSPGFLPTKSSSGEVRSSIAPGRVFGHHIWHKELIVLGTATQDPILIKILHGVGGILCPSQIQHIA